MRSRVKSTNLVIVGVIILLALDQISKIIVKTTMVINEAIYVFGTWFQIRFIENPGAAYGFELGGDYGKLALSLFRLVAIGVLIYYISTLLKKDTPKRVLIGLTLILAGALGNLIDSMFYGLIFSESTMFDLAHFTSFGEGYTSFLHGKVVDMLYFPMIDTVLPEWLPFKGGERYIFFSPIFNVADSYITTGVLYLVIFCRKFFK